MSTRELCKIFHAKACSLGVPFYAFHDRDVAPEGASLAESHANLDAVCAVLQEEQQRTGIK
ncbi:MAG: hypothetical protein VB814_11610, partial [Pirellulaceae bacterium]